MRKVKPVEVIPVVMRNKHPIVRGEYSEYLVSFNFFVFFNQINSDQILLFFYSWIHPHKNFSAVHGGAHAISVRNLPPEKILEYMHYLRNRRGFKAREWTQSHVTQRPSIQGLWFPGWRPPPSTAPPPTRRTGFGSHIL